ncbi:ankyrin repeat domain-containing protein, partial [Candidatus Parcubacteria bacterium]
MAEQVDSYERALALVRAGKSEELRKMLRGEEVAPGDKDSSGRTLLHHAAEVGEPATIDALLGCGAQPNVVDCNGKTPADVALEHSKFAAAQRLAQSNGEATYYREHPALAWKRVLELKGKERLRGIETLSLLGIDPNAVVMGKLTPLVCVVMEDDIAAARCLIKQGADVRCETNRGRTALHWA